MGGEARRISNHREILWYEERLIDREVYTFTRALEFSCSSGEWQSLFAIFGSLAIARFKCKVEHPKLTMLEQELGLRDQKIAPKDQELAM